MTETAAEKPRRAMTEEHRAKLNEGRRLYLERRAAERAQSPPEPLAPPTPVSIDHDGQRLTKTSAAEIQKKAQDVRSLEAVAQKHVARMEGLVDFEDSEQDDGLPAEGEFHTAAYADVPPPPGRIESRERPTVLRDEGDETLRNLTDLISEYGGALTAQTCFIRVERLKPPVYDGLSIKGLQRRIDEPITEQDFIEIYGGGTYELVVYGPSQRGHRVDASGRTLHRRLTRPITVIIPNHYPPNIDAVVQEDDDDEAHDMLTRGVRRTTADAKIHEVDIMHHERREERDRRETRERIEEERSRVRDAERSQNLAFTELTRGHDRTLQMMKEGHEMQLQMMREEVAKSRDAIEALQKHHRPTEGEVMGRVLESMSANKSTDPDAIRKIEQLATTERERIVVQHQEEMRRLGDQHRNETERFQRQLEDERRRADERIELARKQADERVMEIQRQAKERVEESEKRADRDQRTAKEDGDRRVRDIEETYKARIQDLERGHKRDLTSKDDSFTMRRESLDTAHVTQLEARDSEINRLRDELALVRVDANKGLAERMEEFSTTAEHMGFSKSDGGEEKDWKSALAAGGMGLLGQLPELAKTITQTLQNRQQNKAHATPAPVVYQLPPQVQGRGGSIAAGRELAFATEDGPPLGYELDTDVYTPPIIPGQQQMTVGPTRKPVFTGDSHELRGTAPEPRHTAEPMIQKPPRVETQIVPRQPTSPPPRAQQQQDMGISDEQIVGYSQTFRKAFDEGATPEQYADEALQQLGPDMVRAITVSVSPDRIIAVLQQHDPTNSLVRREGQRFLRDVWELAQGV